MNRYKFKRSLVSSVLFAGLFVAALFPSHLASQIRLGPDLVLYTGDWINLRADDGTYLKRFDSLKGHSALLTYETEPDQFGNFLVEVIDTNKVRLIADNEKYLKRFCCWRDLSFISMDNLFPDDFSDFIITPKDTTNEENRITLQAAGVEENRYLKRFCCEDGRSVIVVQKLVEDQFSIFKVQRSADPRPPSVSEKVSNIQFGENTISLQLKEIGVQTFVNNTDQEQTFEFTAKKEYTNTKTISWSNSFSIGIETSFSAMVPLLGETGVTVDVATDFTKGGEESTTQTYTIGQTWGFTIPPRSVITAKATFQEGTIDVPFIATITRTVKNGRGDIKKDPYKVTGTYKGVSATMVTFVTDDVTSVDEVRASLPQRIQLEQNYPNPFNPSTEIQFQLPKASRVVIEIFNTLGEKVRTLVEAEHTAGYHEVHWDGKDNNGNAVASGVYLYQLTADGFTQAKKMSLLH